jgi:iron complex transport system permease protein
LSSSIACRGWLWGCWWADGWALAGGVFQAALRNELATPYTLGVSGGAALGALSALRLSGTSAAALAWGFWLRPAAALAGAMACAAIIGGLARARARSRRGPLDAASILLAGATINILCGAGVLLIQYLSDPYETFAAIRWLMGGLDAGGRWESSAILAALGFPLALLLCLQGRALDALNLGEATAHSLGVSVGRTRTLALGGASALAALCVAFAGPIGFVGLIAPHAVRLVLGPSNRLVLPASILLGSAFLAGCDAAGRALFATEVPAGLATALLGGPVFLALLLRRGGDS